MNSKLYIAAYDISCPKRLRKILYIIKNYSCGGQKSVHECYLDPLSKIRLLGEINNAIDLIEDSFVLIRVKKLPSICFGIATKPFNSDVYYLQ